jgi:hypothetical protein
MIAQSGGQGELTISKGCCFNIGSTYSHFRPIDHSF